MSSGSDAVRPLTPESRRRPEYAGGSAIVLPDGRPWRFFAPSPVVRDMRGEHGAEGHMIAWDFGPGVDAETNDALGRGFGRLLAKIERATNDTGRACGMIEAAWYLLARNYDVSAEEFEDLLLLGGDSPEKRRCVRLMRNHVVEAIGRMVAFVAERIRAEEAA